jgi:plastocyanin
MIAAAQAWAPPPGSRAETGKEVDHTVEVETLNLEFVGERWKFAPGETIRWVVHNPSSAFHTFTIFPSPRDRNALVNIGLSPGQSGEAVLAVPDEPSELCVACLPHDAVNMVGSIQISDH